jgi:hypothetical protein
MSAIVISDRVAVGLCCDKIPGGWTWTLTQRLGELLREIEQRYGERDRHWTILGIEFGGPRPGIWYPGNCGHVSIRLSDSARNDPQRALYQLAHEAIHLLSPTGGQHAPTIEEGLATIYSANKAQQFGFGIREDRDEYLYARLITQELLNQHPDAIKRLRKRKPSFRDFTPKLLRQTLSNVPEKLATELCEPFQELTARLNHPDSRNV